MPGRERYGAQYPRADHAALPALLRLAGLSQLPVGHDDHAAGVRFDEAVQLLEHERLHVGLRYICDFAWACYVNTILLQVHECCCCS